MHGRHARRREYKWANAATTLVVHTSPPRRNAPRVTHASGATHPHLRIVLAALHQRGKLPSESVGGETLDVDRLLHAKFCGRRARVGTLMSA